MSANNDQIGGDHYRASIQHWDFAYANELNIFEVYITKYVTRCRKKNGLQDLYKAKHALEKYIEVMEHAEQEKNRIMKGL